MKQITLPVRVMKMLGIKHLLISNAAGNMNLKWKKGELMLIEDHINLQPDNPLRGENFEILGPRFPDMSQPYAEKLNKKLVSIAKAKKIKLNKGVYAGVMGGLIGLISGNCCITKPLSGSFIIGLIICSSCDKSGMITINRLIPTLRLM